MSDLEQFCILAKAQKSRACATLLQQVLSHRRIFVFGELLALPSVQSLKDSEFFTSYNTLELFAYGNYQDYIANKANYIDLTEDQLLKLKQLSIVTLAVNNKVLSFESMQQSLGVDNTHNLEELIVTAMYAGLITGKIDQRSRILRIKSVIARDVRPEEVSDLITTLTNWKAGFNDLIIALQNSSNSIQNQRLSWETEQASTQEIALSTMLKIKDDLEGGDDMKIDERPGSCTSNSYRHAIHSKRAILHSESANSRRYGNMSQFRR